MHGSGTRFIRYNPKSIASYTIFLLYELNKINILITVVA